MLNPFTFDPAGFHPPCKRKGGGKEPKDEKEPSLMLFSIISERQRGITCWRKTAYLNPKRLFVTLEQRLQFKCWVGLYVPNSLSPWKHICTRQKTPECLDVFLWKLIKFWCVGSSCRERLGEGFNLLCNQITETFFAKNSLSLCGCDVKCLYVLLLHVCMCECMCAHVFAF